MKLKRVTHNDNGKKMQGRLQYLLVLKEKLISAKYRIKVLGKQSN